MKEYLSPSESNAIGLADPAPMIEEVRVPEVERLGVIDKAAAPSGEKTGDDQPNQFKLPDQAANWFATLPLQVTGLVSGSVLVVIFTIFILMGRTANRPTAQAVLGEIEGQVQ